MLLNKEKVLQVLPHRDPFMFIDNVLEIIPPADKAGLEIKDPRDLVGFKLRADFYVDPSHSILKGHFPGNPILPGVVLIEIMAQASAFISLPVRGFDISNMNVETLLVTVNTAKFRKPVIPGMKLEIHTQMKNCRGTIATYCGEIFVENEKMAEAEFMAKLVFK
jgi:3-hydroxyacyl-[acyl-carrier-protein] dehydratase